jgi:hypothetical protein
MPSSSRRFTRRFRNSPDSSKVLERTLSSSSTASFESDIEELTVFSQMHLSDSRELLLRLRWLAILSGRLEKASFAVTGVR